MKKEDSAETQKLFLEVKNASNDARELERITCGTFLDILLAGRSLIY